MSQKIKLTNTGNFVLVDDNLYPILINYSWYETKGTRQGYAATGGGNNKILMHRFIMAAEKSKYQIDHINGDKLDNRKENLRICTPQENQFNRIKRKGLSSKYKGVYWNSAKNKWQVSVKTKEHKTKSLGRYDNEIAAAKIYDIWAEKQYGTFAKLNFPKEE